VLDAKTGKLKWYYQISANDGLDWDLGAAPMLFGQGGSRVALGSKDGHVYVVDRSSHKLIWSTAVTKIENFNIKPTKAGVHVCPGPLGGIEWNSPAYDPQTKSIYAGAVEWCAMYTTIDKPPYAPPGLYMGGTYSTPATDTASGWLTAVDAATGKVKWQFHAPQPIVAGVTPTAGGVVFNGDLDGNFYAFDAGTGKVLYSTKTQGPIAGGIVTYMARDKQYVATTSGNVSRTAFRSAGVPTLIIFALGAPSSPATVTLPALPTTAPGGPTPTEHADEGAAKSSPTGPKTRPRQ
jgi:glucose dehydrogenase